MIVTPANTKPVTLKTAYKSIIFSILGALFWAIVPVFGWYVSIEFLST